MITPPTHHVWRADPYLDMITKALALNGAIRAAVLLDFEPRYPYGCVLETYTLRL